MAQRGYRVLASARDAGRLNALAAEFAPGLVIPLALVWCCTLCGANKMDGFGPVARRELPPRLVALARFATKPRGRGRDFMRRIGCNTTLDLADAVHIRPRILAAVHAAGALDGVINNAGIGEYKTFLAHTEAELITLIQVNLTACMQICHALLPILRAQGHGHIVNIGSDLGGCRAGQIAAPPAACSRR